MSTSAKPKPGLQALIEAHKLAVAPFIFQTTASLKDLGILPLLDQHFADGLTEEELIETLSLDDYTIQTLLPAGEAFGVLEKNENRWFLSKLGFFLLNDPLVKVNFDFTRDICYEGLSELTTALKEHRPAGLKAFDPKWTSIYPHLRDLPEPAKTSWFAFDHFYSDEAYRAAFPIVRSFGVKSLVDIGGNTGKWATFCCENTYDMKVTICDFPEQCETAMENARANGLADRISVHPINLLTDTPIPEIAAQAWWMSQFLDCFSPTEVVSILKRLHRAMNDDARLFILEPLTDRQPFEVGHLSLTAYSLYFTTMANGNSRFYALSDFESFLNAAGFKVEKVHDNIGVHSTLLVCQKVAA